MAGPLALLPLAGKAIMWGGTALGGVAAVDGISKIPDNRADEIALKGPTNGKYDLNIFDSLLIDKDSLTDRRNKLLMDAGKKDSRVQQAQSLDPSLQLLSGQTIEDFLSKNSQAIKKAQRADRISEAADINNAQWKSPQAVYERKQNRNLREDANNLRRDEMTMANNRFATTLKSQQNQFAHTASESAKDRSLTRDLDLSSNNMNMQMKFMDMDLADKRMAYDRETRRMDKRDRMIAQLMSGLGQLGGAFAL